MRTLILTFALLLSTLLPSEAQTKFDIHPLKKIEANPINVAVILTERPDSVSIASICKYYGYVPQPPQDGYTVFRHTNGSVIRYKFSDDDQQFPTIEVMSKASQKEKEEILKTLNFKKIGNFLERHSIGYTTDCAFGPHNTLIITLHSKPR